MKWGLLLFGFAVHLLFFYSIFDIYFTSPLVHGMTPQVIPAEPPAKRLLFFVADGLRADKLYEVKEDGQFPAPYLRNIMDNVGAWGVSHTRVPTESRPGHVALIAGFYEDVSAVAKGWKENPVEFDSVFNESRYTWSWGSPDILPMFSKGASGSHVFTHMYPAESEDFAGADSSKLDTWVFDSVQEFLREAQRNQSLRSMLEQDKIVLFLHLLGLDTNGHSHKPYSREYLENIRIVDIGVRRLVEEIEAFFGNDGKTAYVLSSDHGMTDWGSHGAGHSSETLTPLIAWGAGIRQPVALQHPRSVDKMEMSWNTAHLRRQDVMQADVCPLMAALIGVPYPLNSVGVLPMDYLDNSDQYKAQALYSNALQILAQFDIKMKQKQDTTLQLLFTPFKALISTSRQVLMEQIRKEIEDGQFESAISDTQNLIKLALEGLLYYHNYDRMFLGASIVFGFLGWMAYIVVLILQKHTLLTLPPGRDRLPTSTGLGGERNSFWQSEKGVRLLFIALGTFIATLLYVQSLPMTHYCYTLLPVLLWHKVVQQRSSLIRVWWYIKDHGYTVYCVSYLIAGLVGLEIIVLTFFSRNLLSVGLFLLSVWPLLNIREENKSNSIGWFLSSITLAVFPLLPPVGRVANYDYVFLAGVMAAVIAIVITMKQHSRNRPLGILQVGLLLLSVYLVWSTSSSIHQKQGLPKLNQICAWLILGISIVIPLLTATLVYVRLLSITCALLCVYLLLSTSHEAMFVLALCALLYFWLHLEKDAPGHKKYERLEELDFSVSVGILDSPRKLQLSDLRIAYFFILLLITAFYGTGNIASVNSFDPSTVYCFLTIFNPFVMGALLLLKIVIPFILVSCTFNAIHLVLNVPTQSLFLLVLLMSDFMGLHFFLLVRDSGSWLDIGTSISHYVIVMCLCLFLLVLLALSHFFTNFSLRSARKKHVS